MNKTFNIEVNIGEQSVYRALVLEDNQVPEETKEIIQSMVDSIINNQE